MRNHPYFQINLGICVYLGLCLINPHVYMWFPVFWVTSPNKKWTCRENHQSINNSWQPTCSSFHVVETYGKCGSSSQLLTNFSRCLVSFWLPPSNISESDDSHLESGIAFGHVQKCAPQTELKSLPRGRPADLAGAFHGKIWSKS